MKSKRRTIINPGVIAPSHTPRMKRTAKRPPNDLHAAWDNNAIDQMKILILAMRIMSEAI